MKSATFDAKFTAKGRQFAVGYILAVLHELLKAAYTGTYCMYLVKER